MNQYILIWSVCSFVEARVQEEIHLEELACQIEFSLAHIRDVFRENTGKPLSRYIHGHKIANAMQLLLYTDDKIIDIAMRYGYLPGYSLPICPERIQFWLQTKPDT